MKKFNHLSFLIVFALLFTSCSKEDSVDVVNGPAKSTLSFGTFLNDMTANKAAIKQAFENIPECSDDAPVYVEVVLSQNGSPVVGTIGDPLRVNVNSNPADYDEDGVEEYFTNESADLELDPGTYSLEYFTVLNANEEIIWVAPYDDGDAESFAGFVNSSLPLEIHLTAGAKKYVDVEVLCFDDRVVNEYGYQFFDLETNEAFEFCFFANLCDENGKHYPAHYSVDVWIGTDDTGKLLYSDKMNAVDNEGENPSAAPLCLALPDLPKYDNDEDYIYYEVTLMDWGGVYGDVEENVISGTLSRNDIEANFDGDNQVDYEHLRFGCDDDNGGEDCPGDDDCDGVPNLQDQCPNDPDPDCEDDGNGGDGNGGDYGNVNEGCDTTFMFGEYELNEDFDGINAERWGWANLIEGDGTYIRDLWAGAGQNDTDKGTLVGRVIYVVDGDEVLVTIDLAEENTLTETHIYLDGDEPAVNGPGEYGNTNEGIEENSVVYNLEVEDINEDGSFWIIVHAEVCGDEEEED